MFPGSNVWESRLETASSLLQSQLHTPLGAETKGIGELFTSSVPKMSQEKFFYPEIGSDMNLNGSLKSLRC